MGILSLLTTGWWGAVSQFAIYGAVTESNASVL